MGDSEEDIDRLEGAKVDTLGRTLQKGTISDGTKDGRSEHQD